MKIGSVSNNTVITPNISKPTSEAVNPEERISQDFSETPQMHLHKEIATNGETTDDPEILKKSVEQANKTLKLYDRKIEATVHEVTKTVMYKLKDTKTNEVIVEFPPKKIQDMIAKMWELAGLFVDEKA